MAELPLLRRFPALASLPRVSLGRFPTPVQPVTLPGGRTLWIKRDDRSGDVIGGNKVRGLEWLLAGLTPRDRVLTVGPRGSTHALATARCARLAGAPTTVVRWNQPMNPAARRVEQLIRDAARVIDAAWLPAAYGAAVFIRATTNCRWIPAGGTTPPAVLGHVNGALELVDQAERGKCSIPDTVVVPFGTGGTAAGLALGFRIAGVSTRVVAVRVVPRVIGRRRRILRLAESAARLIERQTGRDVPRVDARHVAVDHAHFGGGYGKPLPGTDEGDTLRETGVRLDDTYSRKALAAAIAASAARDRTVMLWLTFDGRLLADRPETTSRPEAD